MKLESYVGGQWRAGDGHARAFINPTTGEALGEVVDGGFDIAEALDFAREMGTPALSSMSFAERGNLLLLVLLAFLDRARLGLEVIDASQGGFHALINPGDLGARIFAHR